MKLKKLLKNLEKRKIISRKPSVGFVFLLSFAYFILWLLSIDTDLYVIISLITLFTIIFSIIHIVIVRMLEK